MANFIINGVTVNVDAHPNTPLLWVVREHLKLTGTKFGCGVWQCGTYSRIIKAIERAAEEA